MVLGFACTAGATAGVETELYLDPLQLDCTSPSSATFGADITLNPSGAAGNQCTAGANGMTSCTGVVTESNGVDADVYLYQLGVYRGLEQLTSGGVAAQKVYWNVALGVKPKVGAGAGIEDCWLKTQGTADDANGTSFVAGGTIAAGAVYPYIQWEVNLATCGSEPLTFGDDTAMVRADYTTTGGAGQSFAYGFGPSTCGTTSCPSLSGYDVACNDQDHCEYTASAAAVSSAPWRSRDVWIWVPPGSFAMGAPSGETTSLGTERPVHTVSIAQGYFIMKYELTVAAYEACEAAGTCTAPSVADWDGNGWGLNRTGNVRSDHPQNGVTWQQARDVCGWAASTTVSGDGSGRLPSESEWEYAASGAVHRIYPWGDSPAPTCGNDTAVFNEAGTLAGYGCGTGGTWAVGSKPAGVSAIGALDMAGNIWEWNDDCWHDSYSGAPTDASAWTTNCTDSSSRMLRGGSFAHDATVLRSSYRGTYAATNRYARSGARCVRGIFP